MQLSTKAARSRTMSPLLRFMVFFLIDQFDKAFTARFKIFKLIKTGSGRRQKHAVARSGKVTRTMNGAIKGELNYKSTGEDNFLLHPFRRLTVSNNGFDALIERQTELIVAQALVFATEDQD